MNNAVKYTLSLRNRSDKFVKFTIFQIYGEAADITVKPLPLAWIVGSVAPGGKDRQSVSEMSWRTARSISLINSHHIGTDMFSTNSVVLPIDAADKGCAAAYMGDFPFGAPDFVGSAIDNEKGFFLIRSDGTIPASERQHEENCFLKIGFFMANRQVSVADLHPDAYYRFSLEPVYRIVNGEFFPGQIIGDQAAEKSYKIDFGQEFNKTIAVKEDGAFTDEK
ncbi:MAG: hypothetical protein LBU13_10565 [Synergistaceae bacterium]|jgi:hypothetical protein|nr:hypothetical protein [Synergistaceae bacterium]